MSGKLHQKNFIDGFGFQNPRVIATLKSAVVILFLSLSYPMPAQTPEWVYQYVHPDISDEWPNAIVVDSIGNTYTTGVLSSDDTTGGHITGICVVKLNTLGLEQWIYFNDTLGRLAYGNDIALNKNYSQVYVAGYSESFSPHNLDLVIVCVDTTGQGLWVYRDFTTDEATAISGSASNMIYVVGSTYDMVCIKLDSLGNEKWRYVYDGPAGSYDKATSLALDKNENIYVSGYSTGIGTAEDFTVIKLDSAGNEKWVYRYDGPAHANDRCGVSVDTSGYVYAAGPSEGIGWDYCVIKLDSLGNEKWIYRYNGAANGNDFLGRRAVDDSGNVYVSGNTTRSDGRYLFTVIRIDSTGNERWCYLNSGPADMGGSGGPIALNGLGSVYVSGHFRNTADRMQIAVIKFSSAGDTNWVYIHPHVPPSPFNDSPRDAIADATGNIYITGKICVSSFDDDIIVLKFPSQNQIKTTKHQKTISNNIMSTICRGEITITSNNAGALTIHDVTGRTILQQAITPARNLHIKLQPGVYFLRIEGGEYPVAKKKIIVL